MTRENSFMYQVRTLNDGFLVLYYLVCLSYERIFF